MSIGEMVGYIVLAEFGLHYFPWRMVPWLRGKELPRLPSYTLGLLGIMVPFTLWLIANNLADVAEALWIAVIAAGGTVFALYGLDHHFELEMRNVEANERESIAKDVDAKS